MILEERRVTTAEMPQTVDVSERSVCSVVCDNFGFHKSCTRWVPRQLTEGSKCICRDMCSNFWMWSQQRRELLVLHCLGDETWHDHCELESKWLLCSGNSLPVSKKFRLWPSAWSVMPMVFWDSQDPICEHYPQMQCRCGMTVSSAQYSDMLQNELWPAVHTKRRQWLTSFSFVTWQCLPSYHCYTMSILETLNTEALEHSARSTVCRWYEVGGAWLHKTTKTVYSIAS